MADYASEGGHCTNGGCIRPVYRTQFCFRCWTGIKWVSVWQRLQNKNGNNPSYVGVPLGFMKADFIQWVLDNPPPAELEEPSIDRIIDELGYVPGNIRWLEKRQNSRHIHKDIPLTHQYCARCKTIKPKTTEHFGTSGKRTQTYCRPCSRQYQAEWRASHG